MNMMASIPKNVDRLWGVPTVPPRVRQIIHEILEQHGMPWSAVSGTSRNAKLVRCRMMLVVSLVKGTNWSFARIARLINKHYSTVIHYVKKLLPDLPSRCTTKLTPDDVRNIRLRRGERATDIAREFNVDNGRIYAIWRGTAWKGVV
mgnify:FL=1